ncbi:MAG TPA: M23 family metallopeptidase, partial [Symbiobacteriaceae bacterium]|nr:M23 family metallopeptidase [Symbiobacteriaceae bacterium]
FGWRVHPVYGTDNFHDGVDFDVAEGTPLVAASGGTVTMAGRYGGYGIVVRIDHGNGLVTQYAHMSQVSVSVGEKVAAGQHIGYSGNTGVTTGPHLHFMVMVDGTPADPMPWLP